MWCGLQDAVLAEGKMRAVADDNVIDELKAERLASLAQSACGAAVSVGR